MIIIRESKKVIVDCFHFSNKDWWVSFCLKYLNRVPNWQTYVWKDWKSHSSFDDKVDSYFIDKEKLWENYQKLDPSKICQDLKGKSIIITTSLWD